VTAVLLLAFAGMVVGCFLLIGLSPMEFTESIFSRILAKPNSIKSQINEATRRKKPNFLRREIMEAQEVLRLTNRTSMFGMLCACSLALAAVGVSMAVAIGNMFLAPVLAIGLMFVPFWYIKTTETNYKKAISSELETALSIITTAYLRNEDIITSIEENVHYLNTPVKTVFESFISRIKLSNPDVTAALLEMKQQIDNEVFHEWCDSLILCQNDRSLKSTLTPIVNKLSDMRVVNADLEYLITSPRKEFITMAFLVIGNIPLLYMLNKDWYNSLMNTIPGQVILAVSAVGIFVATAIVIKLTKPIEFKR
jgi:Flp pilus assembly protein TadB